MQKRLEANRGGRPGSAVRFAVLGFLWLAPVAPVRAGELPEFYKSVDRVFWVVDDIERTVAGWQRLGIVQLESKPETRGGVRSAVARLGNITVEFIQPIERTGVFARYRETHGQGVVALVHRPPTAAAMELEVTRMGEAGAAVLASGNLGGERYTLFDTAERGKYALGLIYGPQTPPSVPDGGANAKKVSQYAFVARDLEAVSRYWATLGFPEMSFTHPPLWDLRYHDQPGKFDAILGWQRHGKVVYEWIQPTAGPTTYMDHVAKHGEGLHHIAFEVTDIEREKATWSKAGFPTTQSGAWGERDQPGYGRFAYQDTHAIGGTEIELLWNYRK